MHVVDVPRNGLPYIVRLISNVKRYKWREVCWTVYRTYRSLGKITCIFTASTWEAQISCQQWNYCINLLSQLYLKYIIRRIDTRLESYCSNLVPPERTPSRSEFSPCLGTCWFSVIKYCVIHFQTLVAYSFKYLSPPPPHPFILFGC